MIDGTTLINDNTWTNTTTAQITLAPGLHSLDLRFAQGNGGVGPNGTAGNNGGPAYDAFGMAYNTQSNTATTGEWNQMGATDTEGDTSFFAQLPGAPTSQIVMASNTTLDVSATNSFGLVGIGSLTDAGATGAKVLLGSNTLVTGWIIPAPRSPA